MCEGASMMTSVPLVGLGMGPAVAVIERKDGTRGALFRRDRQGRRPPNWTDIRRSWVSWVPWPRSMICAPTTHLRSSLTCRACLSPEECLSRRPMLWLRRRTVSTACYGNQETSHASLQLRPSLCGRSRRDDPDVGAGRGCACLMHYRRSWRHGGVGRYRYVGW